MIKKFPKEHGAYVVLLGAWFFGIIFSEQNDIYGCFLALFAAGSLFLLQQPLRQLIRSKQIKKTDFSIPAVIFLFISLSSMVILLIRCSNVLFLTVPLLVITSIYFVAIRKRYSPIILSIIGFIGLSLVTPLTTISSSVSIRGINMVFTWVFSILFFCTSISCIEIRLSKTGKTFGAILYHSIAFTIIIGLSITNILPYSAILAMSVTMVRLVAIIILRKEYITLPIKRVGIYESVVIALGVLATVVFH